MNKLRWRLIHLHKCSGITRPLLWQILGQDPTLTLVYQFSSSELSKNFTITSQKANHLYNDLHNEKIIQSLASDSKMCKVVTILDPYYPPLLKTIVDPPLVLYFLGNHNLLTQMPSLSVVGTRNPTWEANRKMNKIVTPLIKQDWVIVSGMAKGIDGIAHRLALSNNGKTIAVLGSGFQKIYPKQHLNLFQQLASSQLVISEYPPETPPRPCHFPERNRIISGLSFGTIVIEAKEKSGSLITVDQALEQGREVYAVPGSPLVEQTSGCHKMIQDGAKLVQNTYDLLEDWDAQKEKWCRLLSDSNENASFFNIDMETEV
ncbi:DNA-protecting protein DprA [Aquibacillus halophilus]|uniref:DNA-protecting protein DprA n=1 Tax=Aquibacillus halophilus TaxID=930132 RepID=A0A6A8DH67_9BACI|nr:DNA-protecting protein DprA [Aquibacillus halophilus]